METLDNPRWQATRRRFTMATVALSPVIALLLATQPADAQYSYYRSDLFGYRAQAPQAAPPPAKRPRPKVRQVEKPLPKNAPPPPPGPHHIVVSIKSQRVSLYSNGKLVMQSPVSTGQTGFATPTGVFSVIQKNRHHKSNIYSGAPMPYMQRLTWSGIALHQGALPGYPASHGCIRLPEQFANFLWRTTKLGARIIVSRDDVELMDIAHPRLFQPKAAPATAEIAPELRKTIDTALVRTANASVAVNQASDANASASATTPLAPSLDMPAEDKPSAANDTAPDTGSAAAPQVQAADTVEAKPVPEAATATDQAAEIPKPELKSTFQSVPESTSTPAPQQADVPSDVLNGFLKAVSAKDKRTSPTGPISVFVSRKEKRLFVRQGFQPLFSMPVKFTDDAVLGTHVFTALDNNEGKPASDGNALRWVAITMPAELQKQPEPRTDKHGRRIDVAVKIETGKPALKAAEALDRIDFSSEAVERISEYMTAGATLIVSDHGLGNETGPAHTDFIVVTR